MNLYILKKELFNYLQQLYDIYAFNKYFKYIMLTVGLCAFFGALFIGHHLFKKRNLEHASASLMECVVKFNETVDATSPNWDEVIAICKKNKNDHRSSQLAPYFDLICSNALLKKGFSEEALVLMEQAASTSERNDISYLIKTKYALMLLENNDEALRSKGLENLIALSEDTKNNTRDMALYQLGRYFFAINDFNKAKDTWSQLLTINTMVTSSPSPWTTLAQQKINQIL